MNDDIGKRGDKEALLLIERTEGRLVLTLNRLLAANALTPESQDNTLIVDLMRLIKADSIEVNSMRLAGRRIDRIHLTSRYSIDICRRDGIVWVSDTEARELTLLLSSRVSWPSLEVSRTARALITAYLQHEGWMFLHSGAVRIEDKNYLVVGDEGKGKTSLLLALMSGGCQYISNERVFVRKSGEQIEALSFPMPVAIGMGTAQQYSSIMEYVYNPEYCSYPHRRMDVDKLNSMPEFLWSSQSDKVQLLVSELIGVFGHDAATAGGQISGVIVPSVVKSGSIDYEDKARKLNKKQLKKIVSRNVIATDRDTRYPAWLPLAYTNSSTKFVDEFVSAVCDLPGVQFSYFASAERTQRVAEYPALVQAALQVEKDDDDVIDR